MADGPDFEIVIVQQGWLGEDKDPGAAEADLCSHGRLRITIGGRVVATGTEEFGISETALALLRTLERDHTPEEPVAGWLDGAPGTERLVFHGCGILLMSGCPLGMDWTVEHLPGNRVRISNVRKWDSASDTPSTSFTALVAEIPEADYRRAVVSFAAGAQKLFEGVRKTIREDWDRQQYRRFWEEYDRLLARFG